ncbi:MAG: hypothetical protein P4M09_21970 [Devosia sp.]|nr:hypothetical protein [Devosia sp.]
MQSFRDIKRSARTGLHEIMRTRVVYLAEEGDEGIPAWARLHTKFGLIANSAGPDGLAARRELKPRIIFMRSEMAALGISLKRGGIVSVETGEAFKLDNQDAPDDITVTWFVTVVGPNAAAGLPVPSDFDE